MKEKKHFIFDVDGTLFSSLNTIIQSFGEVFEKMNIEMPEKKAIKSKIGCDLRDIVESFFPTNQVNEAIALYRDIYIKKQDQGIPLINGTKETLDFLKNQGKTITAFTMKRRKFTEPLFQTNGIRDYFEMIVGSEDVEYGKPSPEGIFKIMEYYPNQKKEDFVFIGDSLHDAFSAKNANIDFIGVLTGGATKQEFKKEGFNYILDSIKNLQF